METIISMLIFLMIVILVFNLAPSSLLSLNKAEQHLRADRVAQSQLNQARALPFQSLVVGSSSALYQLDYGGTTYAWKLEVNQVPGTSPDRIRGLRVTVQWTERDQIRTASREVWVSNVTR